MQRKPNKTIKQNKSGIWRSILVFVGGLIFGGIIGIGAILYLFRAEINQFVIYTTSYISQTQPSGIYIITQENESFGNPNLTSYTFNMLNHPEIFFVLKKVEYPRVNDFYPYSKDIRFNINFSGTNIISRNMVDPKNGNNLGNKISDVKWLEYLTGEFYNLSDWAEEKDVVFSKGNQGYMHINNDTSSTFGIKFKNEDGYIVKQITLFSGEYYINRSDFNEYRIIIEKDPEFYKESGLLPIHYTD